MNAEVATGEQPGLDVGREQFTREVFPAELQDIAERRKAVGLDASALTGTPHTKQGLVGLSLSGGGIRSATFALGAVQALARQGCLKMMDYLSTVSGGGYLGSALSSSLNDKAVGLEGPAFPLDFETGEVEPPALRQLRNGSNYLTGGGTFNEVRLPTVLIRGILLNVLLIVPYTMLAALFTWLAFPWLHASRFVAVTVWSAFGAYLLLNWLYPAFTRVRGRSVSWEQRNTSENILTISLMVFVVAVIVAIGSRLVIGAITASWTQIAAGLAAEVETPFELRDLWKWAILAAIVGSIIRLGRPGSAVATLAGKLSLFLLGLTGPALMVALYLVLLAGWARSPFLPQDRTGRNYQIAGDSTTPTSAVLSRIAEQQLPVIADEILLLDLEARGIGAGLFGPDNPSTLKVKELGITAETRNAIERFSRPGKMINSWEITDDMSETARGAAGIGTRPKGSYTNRIIQRDGEEDLHILDVGFGATGFDQDWWFAVAAVLLFFVNALLIDVNVTSPHGFWRDRLSRVFLFRSRFTDDPTPNDALKLTELGSENPAVPCHLVNTTLNLTGSRVEDMPGRGSDFFMFSRRHCGSYSTGYAPSRGMEEADPHLNLGTAFAISAAATAPNAGTETVRPMVFMLTLLNVRLDYWAPNPWFVRASSRLQRWRAKVARPGPAYLFREALGRLHARGPFVNLSDGGHIENLAIYELLRRRCKVIVCSDAEQDPTMSCASMAKLIRYARIDLGVEIHLDLDPLRLDPATGMTRAHWTVGTIGYGDRETGYLLYVKSSVTGDEAPYIADYRSRNPTFPQESTADQFFDEAQFESYRALGYHAMSGALKSMMDLSAGQAKHVPPEALKEIRHALGLDRARTSGQLQAMASI